MKKKANKRVIPFFGLSMGVTVTMLSLVVLIPLASLIIYTSKLSFSEIIATITAPRVVASYKVSFITAFITFYQLIFGIIIDLTYYQYVKIYNFFGKI